MKPLVTPRMTTWGALGLAACFSLAVACSGSIRDGRRGEAPGPAAPEPQPSAEPGSPSLPGPTTPAPGEALWPAGLPFPDQYHPPQESSLLDTLRPGHPRLILVDDELQWLLGRAASDVTLQAWIASVEAAAQKILSDPVSERVLVGPRLLAVSRQVLQRLYTLGLSYRISHKQEVLDRAVLEMRAVAAFSDWNPSHFLDVAEMTHAMAIGYDWLFSALEDGDRALVKAAIKDKGLAAGKAAYDAKAWWTVSPFNWNNVCNGGLAVGALALADEEPELARFLLFRNVTNLTAALVSFAPDGAWAEGPGYWAYATQYTIAALSALRSALGTEFGLSAFPGIAQTGDFRLHSVGPLGLLFNFADCGEKAEPTPQLFWLARRFDNPLYAWAERRQVGDQGAYGDLLWYDFRSAEQALQSRPRDAWFQGAQIVLLRSSWADEQAVFVGLKGGDNQANHSHLDLGTFVLDAAGKRWATDLGPDDYNLPGYFGKERYSYYRLRTEGHNVPAPGGLNQDPTAKASVTLFQSEAERAFAVVDLTAAYKPAGITRALRGMALLDARSRVLLQDELEAAADFEPGWGLHTRAKVVIDGKIARLTQSDKTLEIHLLAPQDAGFVATALQIPAPQRAATGITKLTLKLSTAVRATRIAVLFVPPGASASAPALKPLADWKAGGP